MFRNELDGILNHFNKVHRKLGAFIERHKYAAEVKQATVDDLSTQIKDHYVGIEKATKVQNNIKSLLGA